MNTLLIDTSTKFGIISVKTDDQEIDLTEKMQEKHSAKIFSTIETALAKINLELNDIDIIAVGIGPGSFTGIRIAVTTARMLAQLLKVPLIPIESLVIWANSLNEIPEGCFVLPAFDAKKKKVYATLLKKENGKLKEIIPTKDANISDFFLTGTENAQLIAIGDGAIKYKEEIKAFNRKTQFIENFIPSGVNSCLLAENIARTKQDFSYKKVTPFYARKSDAEILKDCKKD